MANTCIRLGPLTASGTGASFVPPFSSLFTTLTWVLTSGEYEIQVAPATHGRGINPTVHVYESVGSDFEEVELSITILPTGIVSIKISASPDLRFNGKITIS
jgi:hypothetical protein